MARFVGSIVEISQAPIGVVGVLLFADGFKAWGYVGLFGGERECQTERHEIFAEKPVGFAELVFEE